MLKGRLVIGVNMMKQQKRKNGERGALIVEATIAFPVMFIIVFTMLFAANAYLQKSRVEAIVQKNAIHGAASCAAPLLSNVTDGKLPSYSNINIYPYRYVFGNMSTVEGEIEDQVRSSISNMKSGFFLDMEPELLSDISVKYNGSFLYSTFSVEVDYKIKIPIKMLGAEDFNYIHISARSDQSVTDVPDFIRNVDMVEDYMERFGIAQAISNGVGKITEAIRKAVEWIHK